MEIMSIITRRRPTVLWMLRLFFKECISCEINVAFADWPVDDGAGHLSSKLLLPRPTDDPKDPLVCLCLYVVRRSRGAD